MTASVIAPMPVEPTISYCLRSERLALGGVALSPAPEIAPAGASGCAGCAGAGVAASQQARAAIARCVVLIAGAAARQNHEFPARSAGIETARAPRRGWRSNITVVAPPGAPATARKGDLVRVIPYPPAPLCASREIG
jgi:hypothetical protein